MEPITWSWFFLAVLGGIVGNRADWAASKAFGTGLKAFANHLKQDNQYVDHDLEKALYRCFLLALQSTASECLEQLTNGMKYRGAYQCIPEHQFDVQWLEQRLKQLAKELQQVERSKQVQISLESIAEIELLLLSGGELNQNLAPDVRQKLVDLALQDPSTPASYREKVENSLLERICAYFAFEIKHNQVVRDIFQSQLLVQINQNLQDQQLTLEDIEHILCSVARAVPEVLIKLEALEKAFGRLDYNLNLGFGSVLVQLSDLDQGFLQIIEIVNVTAESVAEMQLQLEQLLQNQQQLQPRNEFWTLTGDKTVEPLSFDSPSQPMAEPKLLEGQLQQASNFYIERSPIEARCYRAIVQPGVLVRIKAPQQMGKTLLMSRVLSKAREQGYRTVSLDFQLATSTIFTNLDKLLRWFCINANKRLGLPNNLADHWQDGLDPIYNSTVYFEDNLLLNLTNPLVLALDNVDQIFEHAETANDFCKLLRGWNDQAASMAIWQKLRLIVVHSTEVYSSLDINSSPLAGVGETIDLQEFTLPEVQDLAHRYGLNWQAAEVEQLMAMVGGHPQLVQVALDHISRREVTLEQLLEKAPTEAGIYSNHLRRHLWNLQRHPALAKALKEVMVATTTVRLESEPTFKLQSMGLIALQGNDVLPRCNLYRQYFQERLRDS
jgi:hypothetical protein